MACPVNINCLHSIGDAETPGHTCILRMCSDGAICRTSISFKISTWSPTEYIYKFPCIISLSTTDLSYMEYFVTYTTSPQTVLSAQRGVIELFLPVTPTQRPPLWPPPYLSGVQSDQSTSGKIGQLLVHEASLLHRWALSQLEGGPVATF